MRIDRIGSSDIRIPVDEVWFRRKTASRAHEIFRLNVAWRAKADWERAVEALTEAAVQAGRDLLESPLLSNEIAQEAYELWEQRRERDAVYDWLRAEQILGREYRVG